MGPFIDVSGLQKQMDPIEPAGIPRGTSLAGARRVPQRDRIPLNRPSDTSSPSLGEGWNEGADLNVRQNGDGQTGRGRNDACEQ